MSDEMSMEDVLKKLTFLEKDSPLLFVKNRFTGVGILLTPEAEAVYAWIMGSESYEDWDSVNVGCSWFRERYPKEYMVLLD